MSPFPYGQPWTGSIMTSSALSSRRTYLRRPKVCRTLPNPGRCEPPIGPIPPLDITGFFEMSQTDWCHGEDHHCNFIAPLVPDSIDPWKYKYTDYDFPPGNQLLIQLWETPGYRLAVSVKYWLVPAGHCAHAELLNFYTDWRYQRSIIIDDWTWTTAPLTVHFQATW